jgi:hypothetical protein
MRLHGIYFTAICATACAAISGVSDLATGERNDARPTAEGGSMVDVELDATIQEGATPTHVESCDRTKPFGPVQELMSVPTGSGIPRLSPDELTLYISVPEKLDAAAHKDLAKTTRASTTATFGPLTFLENVNTADEDRDPIVSIDGLTLFFHSNRPGGLGGSGSDLWQATRAAPIDDFAPASLVPVVNTTSHEAQAYYRTSGGELYFTRDVDGGRDILMAARSGTTFTQPVPLAEINSPAADYQPMVTEDGLTMILSSTRNGTNFDLFIAERTRPSGPWGTPSSLGEINTTDHDYGGFLSSDRCRIYFARQSTNTAEDIKILFARRPATE